MDTNWKETVTEDKVVQKAQTAQLSVCIIIYILLPQTTEQGYKFKKKKLPPVLTVVSVWPKETV